MTEAAADEILTSQEVAEAFRVSVSTVGRWVRKGQIPAVRTPAGIYRIRRSDVEAFLNGPAIDDEAAS